MPDLQAVGLGYLLGVITALSAGLLADYRTKKHSKQVLGRIEESLKRTKIKKIRINRNDRQRKGS